MTKSKSLIIAAPLALAAGALFSTPATAQWHHESILAEASQLDIQIEQATRYGYLSRAEGRNLQRQVDTLVHQYDRAAYGGFNRGELISLNNRLENIEYAFNEATRGYARNDRRGRYDRYARNDRDRHEGRDYRRARRY